MTQQQVDAQQPAGVEPEDYFEFDIVELLYRIKAKWKLVLCLTLAVLLAGLAVMLVKNRRDYNSALADRAKQEEIVEEEDPLRYQSTVTIFIPRDPDAGHSFWDMVRNNTLVDGEVKKTEMSGSSEPVYEDVSMGDYARLFYAADVRNEVLSKLKLDYTFAELGQMVSVDCVGTRLLDITVTTVDDPEKNTDGTDMAKLAQDIASAYADAGIRYVTRILEIEEPIVISEAYLPDGPMNPRLEEEETEPEPIVMAKPNVKKLILYALVGLVLACVIVFFQMYFDDRYNNSEQIARYAGITTLAAVPAGSGSKESMNALCTNLMFCGDDVKKIMVTSCHDGEGKTFTAEHLASAMQSLGKTATMFNADLRDGKGADSLPYLRSAEFMQKLDETAAKYDYTFVDTPAVGSVIDAVEIAKSCDGILVVVGQHAVHRDELRSVKRLLEQTGTPILGAALNKVGYDGYISKRYAFGRSKAAKKASKGDGRE